jgi:hypothetical protein
LKDLQTFEEKFGVRERERERERERRRKTEGGAKHSVYYSESDSKFLRLVPDSAHPHLWLRHIEGKATLGSQEGTYHDK